MKKSTKLLILIGITTLLLERATRTKIEEEEIKEDHTLDLSKFDSSITYDEKTGLFHVKLNWPIPDGYKVTYTDYYTLYNRKNAFSPYMICDVSNDLPKSNGVVYEIPHNKDYSFEIDVDSYYDNLPLGYYRFEKVFEISYMDEAPYKKALTFDIDMNFD